MSEPLFIGMPHGLDYIFDGHAGASPSGAERWMNCTASLGASRRFLETLTPNQQAQFASGSSAARQGTTAHAAAEIEARMILGELDQSEVDVSLLELAIMPLSEGEAYDDEMAEYITEYVDLIRQYVNDRGSDHVLIESRVIASVPLIDIGPAGDPMLGDVYEIPGSADAVAMPTPEDPDLVVVDLKYGDGIDVDVEHNPQARIYGLGALALLVDDEGNLITDVRNVVYHIVQPRLGGIKTWIEPVEDLLAWRDEVLSPALTYALNGVAAGATFSPSDETCQWCPAKGSCAALAEQRMTQATELFDTVVEAEFVDGPGAFPETASLSDERLGSLLSQIEGLVKIKDDLKAEAQRRLYRGGSVPGYKLVSYTPPRAWSKDAEHKLAAAVGAKRAKSLYKPASLLTPKQALVVLKKEHGIDTPEEVLGSLIESPNKRAVVAPVGDRRKDWTGTPPEQMFDDETAEK